MTSSPEFPLLTDSFYQLNRSRKPRTNSHAISLPTSPEVWPLGGHVFRNAPYRVFLYLMKIVATLALSFGCHICDVSIKNLSPGFQINRISPYIWIWCIWNNIAILDIADVNIRYISRMLISAKSNIAILFQIHHMYGDIRFIFLSLLICLSNCCICNCCISIAFVESSTLGSMGLNVLHFEMWIFSHRLTAKCMSEVCAKFQGSVSKVLFNLPIEKFIFPLKWY